MLGKGYFNGHFSWMALQRWRWQGSTWGIQYTDTTWGVIKVYSVSFLGAPLELVTHFLFLYLVCISMSLWPYAETKQHSLYTYEYTSIIHRNTYRYSGVSKRSTVALLCYFLSQWCYFSFLVMKDAARRATHSATTTVTCATAKSSLDTPDIVIKKVGNQF